MSNARLHTFADIWNEKVSMRFEVIEVDEFLTSLLTSACGIFIMISTEHALCYSMHRYTREGLETAKFRVC